MKPDARTFATTPEPPILRRFGLAQVPPLGSRWTLKGALATMALWSMVGVFLAVPDMLDGFQWSETIGKMVEAWSWALLTPAVLAVDRGITRIRADFPALAGIQLLLGIPFSAVHTLLAGLILYPIDIVWWNPLRSPEFAIYFFLGGWVTYCAFVAIVQALKFHGSLAASQIELERVERRLAETQLNALRMQLEPHFLFNTLNAISSELAEDPELAREMIEDLGALLRRSLDHSGDGQITLAQELALLRHYVSIQKIRFGDRLDIRIHSQPEMLSAMVPSMILQPLVENAIRHGIERRLRGGRIMVTARRAGDNLQVHVLDDGVGLPVNWQMDACTGLGVRLTRERVQALHPGSESQGFEIAPRKRGGTEVTICIPLRQAGDDARELPDQVDPRAGCR